MTTLADLNNLRVLNNKQPLKAWKESKAKLIAAYEKEYAISFHANQPEELRGDELKAHKKAKKIIADDLLKEEVARAAIIPHNKVNVASIAKELGINPKVARAKLRKNKVDRNDIKAIRKALTKK